MTEDEPIMHKLTRTSDTVVTTPGQPLCLGPIPRHY